MTPIHLSVNVAASYTYIINGSEGLVGYLQKLLEEAGHTTEVKENTDSRTTSIFVGTAWEVVIANTSITPT